MKRQGRSRHLRQTARFRTKLFIRLSSAAVILGLLVFFGFFLAGNFGNPLSVFAAVPGNDDKANAFNIPDQPSWVSANAGFTTLSATADQSKGTCWTNGPNFNVWFVFQATSSSATIQVISGGIYGTLQYPFVAVWDSAGVLKACATYASATGTLELSMVNLNAGSHYYISVDNANSNSYRGTFSIKLTNLPSNDFIEGATLLTSLSNWNSPNSAFTTLYATADRTKGTCWNNGPNYNRWFMFSATSSFLSFQVKSGGVYGNLQYPFIALWDSAMNQLTCASYRTATGTLELSSSGLTPGGTYYVSVDNHSGASYRGTFSIAVDDQPTYNFIEGAIQIPSLNSWSSANAAYSTIDATPDGSKGSCWSNGPNFNRWFSFNATTSYLNFQVKSGGVYGSLQYPFIALWDSSLNQMECAVYVNATGTLELNGSGLIPGNKYFVSVDNYNSLGYRGTFSVFVDDQPTYNYKAGAIQIPSLSNWSSANAAYSTLHASADGVKGSCWGNGPTYNRWFTLTANSPYLTVQVKSGGVFGTLQYPFIALWDSAMNQIACANYTVATGTLELSANGLQDGANYFITVDNYNSAGYRGTFSLYVNNEPGYNWKDGAILLDSISNWSSANAAYTTMHATPDQSRGSCWSNGPSYNRWFKFIATTNWITLRVSSGGVYGSLQYPYLALWDSSMNQLACAKYISSTGTIELCKKGLVVGNTYYFSVDNFASAGYRGTFSIYANDQPSFDFQEGAIELSQFSEWTSAAAAYTTSNSTSDGTKGSCWTNGPNNNSWFKFTAATPNMQVSVRSGSGYGTLQYPFISVYNSTFGQIQCAKYSTAQGTLGISLSGLTTGELYYLSIDNYAGYSGSFTLGLTGYNPLPVELTEFSAAFINKNVEIKWETAAEVNNDYFTVERSSDGINYESISIVPGAGNISTAREYSAMDMQPLKTRTYYRLRQTDYDGRFEIFDPVTVEFDNSGLPFMLLTVGPNPFSDELNVYYQSEDTQKLTCRITSSSGMNVREMEILAIGSGQFSIHDLGSLATGMYFVTLTDGTSATNPVKLIKK